MEYILFIFQTSTTANRIKKMVNSDLYSVSVVQAPKSITYSCAYALKFDSRKLEQVLSICEQFEFKIKGRYIEKTDEFGNTTYESMDNNYMT